MNLDLNNYNIIDGLSYNINNFINIISDVIPNINNYGANTTISYVSILYPEITKFSSGIPFIEKINPDDFITFEIKIGSKDDMKNLTLLNFHNYSFDVKLPNEEKVRCFASVDEGVQFFTNLVDFNSTVKICLCTSNKIGNYFKSKGYIISKIPLNLLKISSFNLLFRVGILKKTNNFPNLRNMITTTYYQSKINNNNLNKLDYYNALDLIQSWTKPYLPLKNDIYNSVQKNFKELKNYLSDNYKINTIKKFYPYLSNFKNTKYAMQNIFDAISVSPPAQLQGNDTGKSYFLTDFIETYKYKNCFLYILALNHNASNVSLSSNVQIYNSLNLQPINNGTNKTGPDDASILVPSYPVPSIINNDVPTYNLICYNMNDFINSNINKIILTERIQYSLGNFYHIPTNFYDGEGVCFIFKKPLNKELYFLKEKYNINVQYKTLQS